MDQQPIQPVYQQPVLQHQVQQQQQPPSASAGQQPPQQQQQEQQKQENGEEQPKKRRRRRKGAVGDINVALYIKQQQSRGSSRKWRQEWVSVRTIIGGGEVKMLKWVTDTPPAVPTTNLPGFANFQGFAQSKPRKPAAATGEGKEPGAPDKQQQGKQAGALSRLGSTASLDQAGTGQQPQQLQPPKKKSKKQQQTPSAAAAAGQGAAAGGTAGAAAVAAAAAAGGAPAVPPGTEVYLPLPYAKKRRTRTTRPASWIKTCSCFPPLDPSALGAAAGSASGGVRPAAAAPAAAPAAAAAATGGGAAAGQDIKSLAASIAASIAADVHAEPSGSPATTGTAAAAGPGAGAGAGKGTKKRKSGAAAAGAAGAGDAAAGGGDGAAPAAEPIMVGPPGAERFACSVCGRDFATQGALRIHANVHATKNFACTFPGCKKAFADAKKLEKHAKKHTAAAAVLADTAAAAGAASGAEGTS